MGNSNFTSHERRRAAGFRIIAMVACAVAFAAGVLMPAPVEDSAKTETLVASAPAVVE